MYSRSAEKTLAACAVITHCCSPCPKVWILTGSTCGSWGLQRVHIPFITHCEGLLSSSQALDLTKEKKGHTIPKLVHLVLFMSLSPLSSLFLPKKLSPAHRCSIKAAKQVMATAEITIFIPAISKERDQSKPVNNAFQTTGTAAVIACQLYACPCCRWCWSLKPEVKQTFFFVKYTLKVAPDSTYKALARGPKLHVICSCTELNFLLFPCSKGV